jgi:hypothetical protein
MYRTELDIDPKQFPELVNYFEKLIGEKKIETIYRTGSSTPPHFWFKYIKAYKQWRCTGAGIEMVVSNQLLSEFAFFVKAIQVFECDWNKSESRKEFLRRLRKSDCVESLLFELRAGTHFKSKNLNVHWVANLSHEPVPDLEIILSNNKKVFVECIQRKPSVFRQECSQRLIDDLLNAANRKLRPEYDWGCPRLIAVRIPENVDWKNEKIKARIVKQVKNWSKEGRLVGVNALYFMGMENLIPDIDPKDPISGNKAYRSDQTVYCIRNPFAKYKLPQEVADKLIDKTSCD